MISTDTAFLLGALAIIGPKHPARLRTFLLTLAVVDDIGALGAIALFYTDDLHVVPLIVALVALAGIFFARRLPVGRGLAYGILSLVVWLGFDEAGIHATLAGVAVALLLPVFPPKRKKVERALALATSFRQSPNPMYAAAATRGLRDSISINERLHESYAPFTSFVVLPIFALANAGVVLDAATLGAAARSRLTWGIVAGLVIGKLLGITLATRGGPAQRRRPARSRAHHRPSHRRRRAVRHRLHDLAADRGHRHRRSGTARGGQDRRTCRVRGRVRPRLGDPHHARSGPPGRGRRRHAAPTSRSRVGTT